MPNNQIKVTLIDHMGSDLSVVNAARVSFGKESHAAEWKHYEYPNGKRSGDLIAVLDGRDTKLVNYLAKHEHLSPFGHSFACFHVKAPIFVARQLVKHKFLRWNEISRRYVDDEPEFYEPDVWRGRADDKKQGSDGVVPLEHIDNWTHRHVKDYWHEVIGAKEWTKNCFPEYSVADDIRFHYNEILENYKRLLTLGVAPEQARMILPQSTMTEWYWSGSLDAFTSMCNLRLKEDTQYESRLVAQQIGEVMSDLFPVSWKALVSYPKQ